MGNSRHRWTLDEENALRAGVGKYGTGKWRKILTDEEFAPRLIARNNVDLKDKWRNLCGNASRTTVPLKCTTNMETDIRNLKALPSTSNSDGLDVVAIHSYPENLDIQELVVEENQNVELDIKEAIRSMRESGYGAYEIVLTLQNLGVQYPPLEEVFGAVKQIQEPPKIRRYSERIVKKNLSKKVYTKDGKGNSARNPLNLD